MSNESKLALSAQPLNPWPRYECLVQRRIVRWDENRKREPVDLEKAHTLLFDLAYYGSHPSEKAALELGTTYGPLDLDADGRPKSFHATKPPSGLKVLDGVITDWFLFTELTAGAGMLSMIPGSPAAWASPENIRAFQRPDFLVRTAEDTFVIEAKLNNCADPILDVPLAEKMIDLGTRVMRELEGYEFKVIASTPIMEEIYGRVTPTMPILRLTIKPRSLKDFGYLQLLNRLLSGTRVGRCENCGRFYDFFDRNVKYCSLRCQNTAKHRRLRERKNLETSED